jgi:hypothetical protein
VPWANAGLNLLLDTDTRSAVWEQRRVLLVLNYATLSVAIVLAVWGSRLIVRRLHELDAGHDTFASMSRAWPPIAGVVLTAVVFGAGAASDGATAVGLRTGTWLVIGIALWSFLWTYVTLQFGLDALGRQRIGRDRAHVDPGLGLRPLGGLAFTALWILLAAFVPIVLTGLPDLPGVAVGATVLAFGLGTFSWALVRLHRQMVAVKHTELALARDLYAQAYAPVRESPSLETLESQRSLLGAADALEKRARGIHDWPIDEGTFARVLTIATSVVAITIGRLILDPLGL